MGTEKYREAQKLIREEGIVFEYFPVSDAKTVIDAAENVLKQKFPEDYHLFLYDYGTAEIGAEEIYGIIDTDFLNSGVPDAVWITLKERSDSSMRKDLVIIYANGMGDYYALDFGNQLNGEPKVVLYSPGYSEEEQQYTIIADSFGDFFYNLVVAETEE
ncbi:SMI1/KNR4 family protein [Periweissella cryptocerci]|uniref:SMI1/KNR4 family protein n=1 Tax=Periweissella cryptocerci TaxID=2506420 RepID=A0A4P6YSM7_9LACO|nr:SMI1/KNR4 family protein [Periweissella cryptocerci]QBO35719.1 SMI1/KNR4 family protein [Periweissella cryptocerci]